MVHGWTGSTGGWTGSTGSFWVLLCDSDIYYIYYWVLSGVYIFGMPQETGTLSILLIVPSNLVYTQAPRVCSKETVLSLAVFEITVQLQKSNSWPSRIV